MRDSRIGVYGALALGLVLGAEGARRSRRCRPASPPPRWSPATARSRLSSLVVIATSRYARAAGHRGLHRRRAGAGGLAVAAATGVARLLGLLVARPAPARRWRPPRGSPLGHLLARARVFERRLGGYTGDCLGATQQLSEAGLYLGVAAWL